MTQRPAGPLVLSLMLVGPGGHVASWRHPDAPDKLISFADFKSHAQAAERAAFDMLFVSDGLYIKTDGPDAGRNYPRNPFSNFEPVTLLSAIAAVTERIGLGGTVSTTYSDPYTVARAIASLDHISGGRAAWNVVTSLSDLEARNFGAGRLLQHADRYERAGEFLEVVKRLWDSWEDDAVVLDKASGLAFDPGRIHRIDYKSDRFDIAGPLNTSRPEQGHPIIIQAGASDPGQELAAATADVVFTAQSALDGAREFYRSLKGRMARYGRAPDALKILPGLFPLVGATQAEAEAKHRELQDLLHPDVGLAILSRLMDTDLSGLDVDAPLPELETNASKSRRDLFLRMTREEGLTVRQLYTKVASGHGHLVIVGSAERIADEMIRWHREEAADGFNLLPPLMPSGLDAFNDQVLPILRERGYARGAYAGRTLREHLGLPRPAVPHAAAGARRATA